MAWMRDNQSQKIPQVTLSLPGGAWDYLADNF